MAERVSIAAYPAGTPSRATVMSRTDDGSSFPAITSCNNAGIGDLVDAHISGSMINGCSHVLLLFLFSTLFHWNRFFIIELFVLSPVFEFKIGPLFYHIRFLV